MKKTLISLVLTIALILNLTSMTTTTVNLEKISDSLLDQMANSNDSIPVSVWLSAPDITAEQSALQTAVVAMQENADIAVASNDMTTINQANDL